MFDIVQRAAPFAAWGVLYHWFIKVIGAGIVGAKFAVFP